MGQGAYQSSLGHYFQIALFPTGKNNAYHKISLTPYLCPNLIGQFTGHQKLSGACLHVDFRLQLNLLHKRIHIGRKLFFA